MTAFGSKTHEVFIGREFGTSKNYSEATAQKIDQEVSRIISESYESAKKLLKEHFDVLNMIADALLDKETLDRDQLEKVVKDKGIKIRESK